MQSERPALVRIGGTTGGPEQAEEVVPPDFEVNPTVVGAGRRRKVYPLAILDIGFPRIDGGGADLVGDNIVGVRLDLRDWWIHPQRAVRQREGTIYQVQI